MKTLITAILLFVSLNAYSQTSLSAGTGEFFSFKAGENSTYKNVIISQVNQLIGSRFILSAITVGAVDSVAKGYIGTGVSYVINQSKDGNQNLIVGVNILKGEQKDALVGASATFRIENTLLSGVFERDITHATNWAGLTISQIILGGK